MITEVIKSSKMNLQKSRKKDEGKDNNRNGELNKTLKGVLINSHVKNNNENKVSFEDMKDSLLICSESDYEIPLKDSKINNGASSFSIKKALLPLFIGTAGILAGCFGLSSVLKHSSKTIMNVKAFEQLPDLAINMNIKEEPQFAIYRAIRDPNTKNILGAAAIFLMSGVTIACKNFIDGAKEIWLKKQSADIERDLQEDLIKVETSSFSGKLKVVNDMLKKNVSLFDSILNKPEKTQKSLSVFEKYIAFKGETNAKKSSQSDTKNKDDFKKNLKYGLMTIGIVAGALLIGKFSLSNLKKTAENSEKFATGFTEKIISVIDSLAQKGDKNDVPKVVELMQSICAKPEYIQETGKKFKLSKSEINGIIDSVKESKQTIFADAPTALGGIPKKVQYYCYIDENRGHLYNWIINPENKFTKYIFMAFTLSSAAGYLFKHMIDAIKDVTVLKENAKTELNLRKRLVEVEIANFKSKKESAVNPLVEDFIKQASNGKKTKDELKQYADNILLETKNGPPYVYT